MTEYEQLQAAVTALQAQRAVIGDAVVDTGLRPLLARLAQLDSAGGPALQLKQVTVLFADIVGSTAIAERLDHEDVVAVMDAALTRFNAAVEAHGGRVFRFMGDGIKAVFGAASGEDAPREDAPECAVRAGLAIIEAAHEHAAVVARDHGVHEFAVRVGISTGQAALGGGVEADNAAMGMTATMAARMEQTAPPGALRISHDTYQHVRGVFDVLEQPPLAVKGRTEPQKTYLVLCAKQREFRNPTRGIAGVSSHLVGRDSELARLRGAFDDVEHRRSSVAVLIAGDAGVGKSRLLHEFQRSLDPHVRILAARAHPHSRLQAYSLLRNLLADWFRIADSDSADIARDKLTAGLASALGATDGPVQTALLGHLIGFDFSATPAVAAISRDARQLRDRAFDVASRWLRALADSDEAPIVMMLDDLHWADHASLAFVQYLLRDRRDLPLLFILLTRPELIASNPDWISGDPALIRISLAPLDAAGSRALASSLLQRLADIPAELCELLTRAAEGNPFYMEELIKMLIDDGIIVVDASDGAAAWRVATDAVVPAKVPSTLVGVLQARLDALGAQHKPIAQQASIIGPVFWDQALARLDVRAPASLAMLLQKDFAQPRPRSAFATSREFAFQHHLLQQVTYDTVPKQARRTGHAQAAAWLAEQMNEAASGRAAEHSSMVAEHYARADNRAAAAQHFESAASEAAARYANEAALENARRALENLDDGDLQSRWRMLQLLDRVHDVMGNRAAQESTLDQLHAVATLSNEPEKLALATFRRALLADRRGDFETAIALARAAIELAEPAGFSTIAAPAYGEWAYVLTRNADFINARDKAERGLLHAERSGDVLAQAQLLAIWADVETTSSNHLKAIELMQRSIDLACAHGHRRLEGLMHGNLGGVLISLGDYQRAQAHQETCVAIAREIGNRSVEANGLTGLATISAATGDSAAALTYARQAVQITTALGDPFHGAQALLALCDASAAHGDYEAAATACDEARVCFEHAKVQAGALQAVAQQAELALARSDIGQAMSLIETVLSTLANGIALAAAPEPLKVRLIGYRVLAAANDPRSEQWLIDAHAELQALGARITDDAMRRQFLRHVPHHRAIADAYANLVSA